MTCVGNINLFLTYLDNYGRYKDSGRDARGSLFAESYRE